MKTIFPFVGVVCVSIAGVFASQAAVTVAGAVTNTATRPSLGQADRSQFIFGFNPTAPDTAGGQAAIVSGGTGFGIGGNFGTTVGFVSLFDTNFFAVFTNQFGTNFVALPFAGTNLASFAGRLPLGPLAPQIPVGAATNSVPGPAPAVPPQVPTVNFPAPNITPVLPPNGAPPTVGQPFPPTGVGPLTPPGVVLPPTGTPLPPPGTVLPPTGVVTPPSGTPVAPQGTPTPSPTPIPPRSTPAPPR